MGADRGSHESEKGFKGFLGRLTICPSQREDIQTLYHKDHAIFGPPFLLQLLAWSRRKTSTCLRSRGIGSSGPVSLTSGAYVSPRSTSEQCTPGAKVWRRSGSQREVSEPPACGCGALVFSQRVHPPSPLIRLSSPSPVESGRHQDHGAAGQASSSRHAGMPTEKGSPPT